MEFLPAEFIEANKWKFAKTYAKTSPHEYCLRTPKNAYDMVQFAKYIRDHGVKEPFYRTFFTYLYFNGWKYWTMDKDVNETTLINRARI